jgi:NTE family protein
MLNIKKTGGKRGSGPWGLTLIGGGARGLAHIGVLEVLEESGITPDIVTGTSMGAIIGGLYAAGVSSDDLARVAFDLSLEKSVPSGILSIIRKKTNPLLNYFLFDIYIERAMGAKVQATGDRAEAYFKSIIGDVMIEDLPVRFGCNAVDLVSGREHHFTSGPLYKAIRASMAYPMALDPVKMKGGIFLDGGIVNNAPVRLARKLGAERVMVSDIDRPVKPMPASRLKKNIDILERALHIAMASITEEQVREADFVLRIPLNVDVLDFSRNTAVVRRGRRAAEDNLAAIRSFAGLE